MDFKASQGRKREFSDKKSKIQISREGNQCGVKNPPVLRVTPKEEHFPWDQSDLLIPCGQKHLYPLNPCWLLLTSPLKKKSWSANAPLHPNLFPKKIILLLFIPLCPHPAVPYLSRKGGLDAGWALCAGKPRALQRRFCLLARLGLQCSPSKPLDEFPFVVGGGEDDGQMSQRLPPAPGRGRTADVDEQEGILRARPPRRGYIKPREDGRFPAAIPDSLLQPPAQDSGDERIIFLQPPSSWHRFLFTCVRRNGVLLYPQALGCRRAFCG